MDDRTPSDPNAPGRPHQEVPVPNPHRGEPVPPVDEGVRPEADPAIVRPDEDEPNGPVPGLLETAGAEAAEEATPGGDPEAEALLAQMGVEEEGVEAGQLLGLVAATITAILALVVVLIFLFYEPFLGQTQAESENVGQYPELEAVRTEATAKLTQYARTDSTYAIPIDRAMGLVAAEDDAAGTAGEAAAGTPTSNAQWNTLMVMRGPGRAIQTIAPPEGPAPDAGDEAGGTAPAPSPLGTGEEVGVDESEDVVPDDN